MREHKLSSQLVISIPKLILTIVSYRIVVQKGNRRYDLGHQRSLEPNHLIGLDHVQIRIICVF